MAERRRGTGRGASNRALVRAARPGGGRGRAVRVSPRGDVRDANESRRDPLDPVGGLPRAPGGERGGGSLATFFGDVGASDDEEGDEEEDEEEDEETSNGVGVAWDVDQSPLDASERARRADALDPANTFFVETGLTDALLHVTMGSHPLSHRVQIAALRAIRTVASEPCGEGTRRRLGAAGALDRVAAAATAAEFYGGEDTAAAVREEAKTCLRALTMGCEQNMRAALALGCEGMVW